jgi:LysR family hydrogen peroxide-inducible transcriptional activator
MIDPGHLIDFIYHRPMSLGMTLRELEYLVAVADAAHFGRAAAACNVSQPTLSMQLKKLEDRLGVVLVERTNRRVALTAAGERVAAQARRVLAESEALVAAAKSMRAPLSGPLHVGVIPTLAPYMLPWAIPALRRAYPTLDLVVHEEMTDPLLARLDTHTLDIAVVALPVQGLGLMETPLFDEPFVFLCHKDSGLAKAKRITADDIPPDHLLLLTDGHCLRDQALDVCGVSRGRRGAAGDFTATSLETLKQLVANNVGYTLLPVMAGESIPARGPLMMKALTGSPSRRIGLAWRGSHPQAAHFGGLAAALRKAAPKSVVLVPGL